MLITTFIGPVFSGKSTALVRLQKKYSEPLFTFTTKEKIVGKVLTNTTHGGSNYPVIYISNFSQITKRKVLLIDELQFADPRELIIFLLKERKEQQIYFAGLNLSWKQTTFPAIEIAISLSTNIQLLHATCNCGNTAIYSAQTKINSTEGIIREGRSFFTPICGKCLLGKEK